MFKLDSKIKKLEKEKKYLEREKQTNKVIKIQSQINNLNDEKIKISSRIPLNWEIDHQRYNQFALENKKAIMKYRWNVDSVYENIQNIKLIIADRNKLNSINNEIINLKELILNESKDDGVNRIKSIEKNLDKIAGIDSVKEKLSKARRILKKDDADITKVNLLINEANELYINEKEWRRIAEKELLFKLNKFDDSIKNTIGLRLQEKLTNDQAKYIAACRSNHKDISLSF